MTDMDKHDTVRLTGVALDNVDVQQAEGFIISTWQDFPLLAHDWMDKLQLLLEVGG